MPTVWSELIIGKVIYPISLCLNDGDVIDDLRDTVKNKAGPLLARVSSLQLNVYPPGTTVPVPADTEPCLLDSYVSEHATTTKRRYIVVARSKYEHEQVQRIDRKCCARFFGFHVSIRIRF